MKIMYQILRVCARMRIAVKIKSLNFSRSKSVETRTDFGEILYKVICCQIVLLIQVKKMVKECSTYWTTLVMVN